jgi:hypothetical protein
MGGEAVTRGRISTVAAGYGTPHQRMRARLASLVDSGGAFCVLCGLPIKAGAPWDLAHTDDRRGWLGPAHAVCNRGDAGRKTARLRWEQYERRTSRP